MERKWKETKEIRLNQEHVKNAANNELWQVERYDWFFRCM